MNPSEEPASIDDRVEDGPEPGSLRELLQIAIPLALSAGSLSLMHFVDRMFLTWHSPAELAAALPAGVMHWTLMSLFMGTALYVNTFVAQYDGAGRPERLAASIWQGVWLSLAAGLLLLPAVFAAPWIFSAMGHDPHLRDLEVSYFRILSAGATAFLLTETLSCFYSGRGRTFTVMWVHLLAVVVNGALDYCLIFGKGPFPEMGIRGAAIATLMAKSAEVIVFATLMVTLPESRQYRLWERIPFDGELFRRLIRYGLPNGLQFLGDISGIAVFIMIMGRLGEMELAATSLAFNINSLAFLPLMGLGTAVMTLVGRRIGEGRPKLAIRTTWTAFALGGGYMLLFAVMYVGFPDLAIAPFAAKADPTEFAGVRDLVIVILRFVAVFSFFDAMAIVFGSAIRGAGDTRFSLWVGVLSCWLLLVVPTWWLMTFHGGSVLGSWTACTVYITAVGLIFLWRFQSGVWSRMRVIETEEAEPAVEPVTDELPLPVAST